MKKYILNDYFYEDFNAGSKARNDINQYLTEYEKLFIIKGNNKYEKIKNFMGLNRTFNNMKDTLVLVQYPLYVKRNAYKFIFNKFRKLKKNNVKLAALIHDINSLRDGKSEDDEIHELNNFDYIISHNASMSKWLKEKGITSKIVNLDLFDYYVAKNDTNKVNNPDNNDIAFAGNLSKGKSGFLYSSETCNISYILYGVNIDGELKNKPNVKYKGAFKPEELPDIINAKYGLVWDGNSVDSCSGNTGNYLRYNNPHKLSLYVASELPVIVWSEAAVADFVTKNKIGITVDNLEENNNILNNITKNEYEIMLKNVKELSKKVKCGYYIKNATNYIEKDILHG